MTSVVLQSSFVEINPMAGKRSILGLHCCYSAIPMALFYFPTVRSSIISWMPHHESGFSAATEQEVRRGRGWVTSSLHCRSLRRVKLISKGETLAQALLCWNRKKVSSVNKIVPSTQRWENLYQRKRIRGISSECQVLVTWDGLQLEENHIWC